MDGASMISIVEQVATPVITAVIGFFTGHRKRRNDSLKDLQASIDLLTSKNVELIDETIKLRSQIVDLREENLELKAAQERLLKENADLRQKVQEQSGLIEELKQQLSGVKTITKVKKP